MTTINPNQASGNKNFKQVESESWMSLYLPAICAAALMLGGLLMAVSCSKKTNNASAISAPTQPAASAPTPATTTTAAAVPETPKKKAHKRYRPANVHYVNSTFGVSFNYPRKYSLLSGDKLGSPAIQTFLKPGAVQVASVDIPDSMYPETDFASALLNVSVNKDMTSDECSQFVLPSKDAGEVKPTTVKLGSNEYRVFEQISGQGDLKSDLKYFHLFKNNACYEFVLDVDTVASKDADLAQVDRGKVFHQLEQILTSARIKDMQPKETESAQKAPATETPVSDAKTADSKPTEVNSTETKAVDANTADTKTTDVKSTDTKPASDGQNAQVTPPEQK